jgi:hypothetical protein
MEERLDNYNSSLLNQPGESIQFRLLGIFPLLFFLLQGIHYWRINELGNMLWMCNIGNLVLALGLFLNNAVLIRMSVLWMIPGLIVWIIYVVLAWGVFLTSAMAHVGGMVVGIIALRRVGMDNRGWLYALIWYFVLQLVCRLFTSVSLNVNLAHSIDPGWQRTFSSYWKFWLVLTVAVGVVLWILGFVLRKVLPPHPRIPQEEL